MALPLLSARRGRRVPAAILLATLLFGLSASPFAAPPRLHKRNRSAVWAGAGTVEAVTARERFLSVLEAKGGDWRDDEVAKELELLQAVNPTNEPALSGTYLDADWLQVSRADYVVGDGSGNYTLGQLSFNMYKPTDMRFRVDKTTQVVAPLADSDARRWDISMDLTCVDERYLPFQAKMTTYGQIVPGKISNRLEVSFSGGDLRPAPGTDQGTLKAWLKAFSEAQEKKTWSLRGALVGWVMRLTMGLSLPDGVDKDGTISFQMKKPPRGHTDILYLDDKLRVTRGNRGSVVVVTRGE